MNNFYDYFEFLSCPYSVVTCIPWDYHYYKDFEMN